MKHNNPTLEKTGGWFNLPKMGHLSCRTLAHATAHFYYSIRLQPLCTQSYNKAWIWPEFHPFFGTQTCNNKMNFISNIIHVLLQPWPDKGCHPKPWQNLAKGGGPLPWYGWIQTTTDQKVDSWRAWEWGYQTISYYPRPLWQHNNPTTRTAICSFTWWEKWSYVAIFSSSPGKILTSTYNPHPQPHPLCNSRVKT